MILGERRKARYEYTPHPRQAQAHRYMVDEQLFGGSAGGGKDIPFSTPILTPDGWTTHGALKPGDQVYGHDGRIVNVLRSHTPETECHYLISFSTGETIRAGREHLWSVQLERDRSSFDRADPEWKRKRREKRASRAVSNPEKGAYQASVTADTNRRRAEEARDNEVKPYIWDYTRAVESHELVELFESERHRISIPSPGPIQTTGSWEGVTPPWVMGMWLGDGTRASGSIAQGLLYIDQLKEQMSAHGFEVYSATSGKLYRFMDQEGVKLSNYISRDFGPISSRFKHIPEWAFSAPYEDRLRLIQGVLDSDGHVNEQGQVELSLSDERLAFDVARLLATLGIRCQPRRGRSGYNGIRCKDRFRMKFTTGLPVFRYESHLNKMSVHEDKSAKTRSIYITGVEKVPADEPSNCITVDDPYQVYLVGRTLVPTHNSRWARAELISFALRIPGSRQVIFRRTFPDLQRSVEEEMKKEIPHELATYNHSKHQWTFYNGSIIELAHLQRRDDVLKYQGAEYARVIFEEATHFEEYQYLYMKSRLRVSGEVRDRMNELGLRPGILATANPGGPGHHFVKKRFVDPYPAGNKIFRPKPTAKEPRPGTRVYVPSTVFDNPSVNPEYIDQLNALPDKTREALRDGNWDVLEGVRFSQWDRDTHVIRPQDFQIPHLSAEKVIAVDYGISAPFAAVWLAKMPGGLVVQYRELYEVEKTAEEQAEMILRMSAEEEELTGRKIPVVMDPSMWSRSTAGAHKSSDPNIPPPGSPAHTYMRVLGRVPQKAVNDRVNGWSLMDDYLRVREDGYPRYVVYETCPHTIRTLPAAPRDSKNPSDVDTSSDDHAIDALRYGLYHMSGRHVLTAEQRRQHANAPAPVPMISHGMRDMQF